MQFNSQSPSDRKLRSPEPLQIQLGKIESTNQVFMDATKRSVFPTMPRKKLKNPDRIKNIFVERRPASISDNYPRNFSLVDGQAGLGQATALLMANLQNNSTIEPVTR